MSLEVAWRRALGWLGSAGSGLASWVLQAKRFLNLIKFFFLYWPHFLKTYYVKIVFIFWSISYLIYLYLYLAPYGLSWIFRLKTSLKIHITTLRLWQYGTSLQSLSSPIFVKKKEIFNALPYNLKIIFNFFIFYFSL